MKCLAFVVVITFSGCTAVHVERKIPDARGRDRGSITIDNRVATSSDVRAIMDEMTRFEETQNRELEKIAADSVARGKPTTVTTQRGNVTSGYTGYGYGGTGNYYGGYNVPEYNPYSDPMAYAPGVAPEMLIAAELARRGGYLPPLAQSVVPYQAPGQYVSMTSVDGDGRAACPKDRPPANEAERISCLEKDRNEMLRMHRGSKK